MLLIYHALDKFTAEPGPPTLMNVQSPSDCDLFNGAQVTIQWTVPTNTGGINVDHYEVDVTGPAGRLDDISCSPDGDCNMVDGMTTIISDLKCSTTYTVKVRAVHCLNGTFSDTMEITIPPPPSECNISLVPLGQG